MKVIALALALGVAVVALPSTSFAQNKVTTEAKLSSNASLPQIEEYVSKVNDRLDRGKYDVLKPKDREWVVSSLETMKSRLQTADRAKPVTPELQASMAEFENGILLLEEGGIVCENVRKTGSRMREQRCMTRKRQAEIREESRESYRNLNRLPPMPVSN